nr:hypothetical protein [Amycolatopsis sp. FDAARGOS 1241]
MVSQMANACPRSSGSTTAATIGRFTGGFTPWPSPISAQNTQ